MKEMDFPNSTHRKRWIKSDRSGVEVFGGNGEVEDLEQTKELVVRSCGSKIHKIGNALKYPKSVVLTAIAYIRRYFAVERLAGTDFSLTILTALYLAGKVEEMPPSAKLQLNQRGVDMDELCNIAKTKKRTPEMLKNESIRNEMKLLVALNFDLLCFHPLRPALGFLRVLKKTGNGSFPAAHALALEEAIYKKCIGCYLVRDFIFIYPPAFLGAVALFSAVRSLSIESAQKEPLLESVKTVVQDSIPLDDKKAIFNERLVEIADIIDSETTIEKNKEADQAYDSFFKRAT